MTDVLGAALEGCPNNPNNTGNLEDSTAAHAITQPASAEGADEASSTHGRGDASLCVRVRMSEVFEILIAANPSRHGAYIEAEQCTADGAARQEVSK